jgi:hypothetical protein
MTNERKVGRRDFLKSGSALGAGAAAGMLPGFRAEAQQFTPGLASTPPEEWDLEADVLVIGAGATGLPAAIRAADAGASVIVVDTNYDIGGHAILSGAFIPLGGGTSIQREYGIEDSPDLVFQDLTDWSIVEINGMPEYRYNDRWVQRAFADNMAPTFEFLVENGVVFDDRAPNSRAGVASGLSAFRENHVSWDGGVGSESPTGAHGTALMRPLEASARRKGVRFLLNYHMDIVFREAPTAGRVVGIQASYTPKIPPDGNQRLESFRSEGNIAFDAETVTIKANKAVVLGTGGSTGNVNFRLMYDPRLAEEVQLGGAPYSPQDASGELAGMAVGAALSGMASHAFERNGYIRKRALIGAQYLYIRWTPESPVFPFARASGLRLTNWQNVICVNQVGKRFFDETAGNWPDGTKAGDMDPYIHGDWRNPKRIEYDPQNYIDAALAMNEGSQPPHYGAGPTWAIFDADAVERQEWELGPPNTDPLYFFSGETLGELAGKLAQNPYQKVPMPAGNLEATVERYNTFVTTGVDEDFEKPTPQFKIQTPPFYAAWASPVVHDTYAGLRINMKCQVLDWNGEVIPGLYCGGESAGGSSIHGLARCTTQGYIAGAAAAAEPSAE